MAKSKKQDDETPETDPTFHAPAGTHLDETTNELVADDPGGTQS